MKIGNWIDGLFFSLPAALLICLGYLQGDDPTRWYLWSIALVIGLPANILLSAVFVAGGVMIMSLLDLFGLAQFNFVAIPFYGLVAAGIVGAQVNAMFITRKWRREPAPGVHEA